MSILYVLSYKFTLMSGSCQSSFLFECMGICIYRACVWVAWFYVLCNIGANGKFRLRPRINQVNNPKGNRFWKLNTLFFISVLIMNSNSKSALHISPSFPCTVLNILECCYQSYLIFYNFKSEKKMDIHVEVFCIHPLSHWNKSL